MTKYPDIRVQLTGEDGNIFSILGRVQQEMRRKGVPQAQRDQFFTEVTATKSYDEALGVVMTWVKVG